MRRDGPDAGRRGEARGFQRDRRIRSPERNEADHPDRGVFDHVYAMEVTWR